MTDFELADQLFQYDSDWGGLLWKVPRGPVRAGERAGGDNKLGYFRVNFKGKLRLVSHIVWLLHNKSWPVHQIDHINRDSRDDRIENLRDVPQAENLHNQKACYKTNKLGVRGVVPNAYGYRATINRGGAQVHLGVFKTLAEASDAYERAKFNHDKGVIA